MTALAQIRRLRGFSQRQLAAKAGCSHATVAHAEQGRSAPSPRMAAKLASALGVPVEHVTGEQLVGVVLKSYTPIIS